MTYVRDLREPSPLGRWRLRLLVRIASLNLFWEKLWPRLLSPLAVCGLFLGVALLDFLPLLPFWPHILALAVFAGILGYSIRGLLEGDYRVEERYAWRRLEVDSGMAHRPLDAINDKPVSHLANAGVLWTLHRARMVRMLSRLRVGLPSPGMARRDPFGFRAAVLIILVIAGAAGVGDARARLERALIPERATPNRAALSINLWITPPAYTGLAPIFLETAATKPVSSVDAKMAPEISPSAERAVIRVPVGSKFLAQVSRGDKQATFVIGSREVAFEALDPGVPQSGARVEGTFVADDAVAGRFAVSVDGRVAESWPARIEIDQVPEVEFSQPPKSQGRGLLRLEFQATDDFGLAGMNMTIRNSEGWPLPGGEKELKIGLPLPSLGASEVTGTSSQDLTAHPWAGTAVELFLNAADSAGQRGTSAAVNVILPERTFNHPVARAIIVARKKLNQPGRKAALDAIRDIEQIAERPAHFYENTIVFLALVVARSRLLHAKSPNYVVAVQRLLWDAALRIEDGEFVIADRNLEDAQHRMMKALSNNKITSRELDRLMDQLQKAMDEYMRALAGHLQREGLADIPQVPSTQMMENGDLQRMMDRTRELMHTGAIRAAKQMLAQLNQMLNAFRQGARIADQPRTPSQGQKMLQGLRALATRQQELLDKTFQDMQRRQKPTGQGQQGQQQKQGDPKANEMGRHQEELRQNLGRLMLQMDGMLGSIPPAMGKADRAMKRARESLGRGDRSGTVSQQTQALERLRQAAEGLAEQLARRMQGEQGISIGRQGQQPRRNRDPFGRRRGDGAIGEFDDGSVKIPDGLEIRRSREILDELRLRSSDQARPAIELEYIDRLMRQF